MATAQDIIFDALQMLGVYAASETMTSADAATGLSVLNDMLDSWSNESLTCYAISEQSGTLQPGVSQYTIGPGGMFNLTRPLRIIDGPGAAYIQDSNQNNYPMDVVPRDVWNLIGTRTVTSNLPDTLFYDPQYPLGIINIFPIPSMNYTIFFDSYLALTEFANLTTALSLPAGYKLALGANLAVALHPYFLTSAINPIIVKRAADAKGNIKRTNMRPNIAVYDPELVSRASATYNIYNDNRGF